MQQLVLHNVFTSHNITAPQRNVIQLHMYNQRCFKYTSLEFKYLRVEYKYKNKYEYMTLEIQSRVAHTATVGIISVKTV